MATIKSFTDISQSKKLSEILPIESADMVYVHTTDLEGDEHYDIDLRNNQPLFEDDIAAWNLAALLGVLPKIHKLKPILDLEENSIQYSGIDLYIVADNPVDACVDMIEKLHELKML